MLDKNHSCFFAWLISNKRATSSFRTDLSSRSNQSYLIIKYTEYFSHVYRPQVEYDQVASYGLGKVRLLLWLDDVAWAIDLRSNKGHALLEQTSYICFTLASSKEIKLARVKTILVSLSPHVIPLALLAQSDRWNFDLHWSEYELHKNSC